MPVNTCIRVSLGQHFVYLLTLIDGSLAVIHLPDMVGSFDGLNCVFHFTLSY